MLAIAGESKPSARFALHPGTVGMTLSLAATASLQDWKADV